MTDPAEVRGTSPQTAAGRPRRKALDAELPTLIKPWTDFRAEQWRLTLDAIEAEAAAPYRDATLTLDEAGVERLAAAVHDVWGWCESEPDAPSDAALHQKLCIGGARAIVERLVVESKGSTTG